MIVLKKDNFFKKIDWKKKNFAYKIIVKKFINKEYFILFSIKYGKKEWRSTPNSVCFCVSKAFLKKIEIFLFSLN
jgi:hypothetical protein